MDDETREAFRALNRRLDQQERDISLCVNYCREVAKIQLGKGAIAHIERELGNGHDGPPSDG